LISLGFDKTEEGVHPELEKRLVEFLGSFSPFDKAHALVLVGLLEHVREIEELVVSFLGKQPKSGHGLLNDLSTILTLLFISSHIIVSFDCS
jgi:hypothetical protein